MPDRTPLAWYGWRLAAMSLREIGHRLVEQVKRQGLRNRAGDWSAFATGPGAFTKIPALARMLQTPMSDGLSQRVREAAEAIFEGRFSALGQEWPPVAGGVRRGAAWVCDPVTQNDWPGASTFAFDIDYRSNNLLGDVKYVWEVNRLRFLQSVAVLAAREHDARHARFAIDTISSWIDANPPYTGVNWSSGIELALRLVSIAIVVGAIGDQLSDAECLRWRGCVAAHALWLKRFPSLYSSANNHRVAEGLGLLTAALLMPDAPEAGNWLATGRAILDEAVDTQYAPDGTGVEQSPTYAAFTLEMLCLGSAFLHDTRHAFSAAWHARVACAAANLRAMLDEHGFPPRIGDDDEGRVVGTSAAQEPRYVASVVAAAARVTGRLDLMPPCCDASLRDLIFGSPETGVPPPGIAHFPRGGYTVIRDVIADRRLSLVFDHGPLGFGSIAAHGHADALSVWLHIDGVPAIVDSGTYLYHSGGEWRDFFRSTAAHNTLELAGLSQSLTAGAFNWRHKARGECTRLVEGRDWEVEGRHDGYRARFGADHLRALKRTAQGFRIEDRLIGARSPLPVAIRFLINPALELMASESRTTILHSNRALLSLETPPGMILRIVRGEGETIGPGWYSPAFGERTAASCIVYEGLLGRGVAVTEFDFSPP